MTYFVPMRMSLVYAVRCCSVEQTTFSEGCCAMTAIKKVACIGIFVNFGQSCVYGCSTCVFFLENFYSNL